MGPTPRHGDLFDSLDATLKADVAKGRLALGGLLGGERLRIYKDGRIEGSAILAPEMLRTPKRTSEPADSVVAGGRYDTVCSLAMPLVRPVAGRVGAAVAVQTHCD